MIDTHAHILKESFENIDNIVHNIKELGVKGVINIADNIETSFEVIELSKKYKNYLFPVVGIHPEYANNNNDLSELEEIIKNNKIYAIGEIGLDYHYDGYDKEKEKELFISQLKLAKKYSLPVVIHNRDSIQDVFNILKEYKVRGIIHCFSGSFEMAQEFIKLGFYLGIGGVLTFKNSKLYEVVEKIDINRMVLETDSPYLSPEPHRGEKNIPSNVYFVAKRIAELKGLSVEEVINITTKNAYDIFDL